MRHVASVQAEGVLLHVARDEQGVWIIDSRPQQNQRGPFVDGYALSIETARKLYAALEAAMQPGSPGGVIAELQTVHGSPVYVKRSGAAVALTANVREHSNMTLRLVDQTRALQAALGAAIDAEPVSDAPLEQGARAGVDEAALIGANADLPEPPVRRQRTTESHAPEGRRAPGHALPA